MESALYISLSFVWKLNSLADATKAGRGNLRIEVMQGGHDVTEHCIMREEYNNFYKLTFNPPAPGSYQVHAYFNEMEVRGEFC